MRELLADERQQRRISEVEQHCAEREHDERSAPEKYRDARHRFRSGERISSAMAESTVNPVVSKRFAKRQQVQFTQCGAHLLLQTRTRALDGTLRPLFKRWHPGLANDNPASAGQAAAA